MALWLNVLFTSVNIQQYEAQMCRTIMSGLYLQLSNHTAGENSSLFIKRTQYRHKQRLQKAWEKKKIIIKKNGSQDKSNVYKDTEKKAH